MEILGKRTVSSRKLKGNGNFHFPLRKLLGKCLFSQNFQHREDREISPFFAVNAVNKGQATKRRTSKECGIKQNSLTSQSIRSNCLPDNQPIILKEYSLFLQNNGAGYQAISNCQNSKGKITFDVFWFKVLNDKTNNSY